MRTHGPTQRRVRRVWRLAALLGALALVAAACGDDDDDTEAGAENGEETTAPAGDEAIAEFQENGVTIGIANERPYGFEDESGEATGEAPELAREVFSRLGIEITGFEVVDFGALINGLNAGNYDVIAAGMFIDPERAQQALFAQPDYCGTTAFAVPEGNPDNLTDFQSVTDAGITLGVLAGAVEEGYALDSGVPEGQVEVLQTTPDLFDALAGGRIDAVALTSITVRTQTEDLEGFEATEGFVPVIDGEEQLGCGAFAFTYDNLELRNAFTEELIAMQEADEVLPIIEEFGWAQEDVDLAKENTANDLAGGAYTTSTSWRGADRRLTAR